MAIWMEVRCDDRNGDVSDCYSRENEGPMILAADDTKSVAAARIVGLITSFMA